MRLGAGPERRRPQEVCGPIQSSERIGLVLRVLGHRCHGQRVEHLEQQRGETTDEHRRQVAVDLAGDRVGGEVGLGRVVARGRWDAAHPHRTAELAADLAPDQLDAFQGDHSVRGPAPRRPVPADPRAVTITGRTARQLAAAGEPRVGPSDSKTSYTPYECVRRIRILRNDSEKPLSAGGSPPAPQRVCPGSPTRSDWLEKDRSGRCGGQSISARTAPIRPETSATSVARPGSAMSPAHPEKR